MPKIEFKDFVGVGQEYYPVPANKLLPEWYKQTPGYNGEKSVENATIKKCMPVFDAITSGYLLLLPVDIHVTQRDGIPWYLWKLNYIDFHPVEQAPKHPNYNEAPYPKFNNNWCITTEAGYSCLFVTPMHRDLPFRIFEGVVDTDTYNISIRLPFVLKDPKWVGVIPAGTPFAQVIPFKREAYEMTATYEQDKVATTNQFLKLRSMEFNSYKKQFWDGKEYR